MNLFVAKLNAGSTSEDLQKLFAHYGHVASVRVILDKETGHSKRYGFVEMPNDFEAKEALRELNETEFQQSVIVVKESQPRENQAGAVNTTGYNAKRGTRPEYSSGSRDSDRNSQSRGNYNRDSDRQGNYGRRSFDNRY